MIAAAAVTAASALAAGAVVLDATRKSPKELLETQLRDLACNPDALRPDMLQYLSWSEPTEQYFETFTPTDERWDTWRTLMEYAVTNPPVALAQFREVYRTSGLRPPGFTRDHLFAQGWLKQRVGFELFRLVPDNPAADAFDIAGTADIVEAYGGPELAAKVAVGEIAFDSVKAGAAPCTTRRASRSLGTSGRDLR